MMDVLRMDCKAIVHRDKTMVKLTEILQEQKGAKERERERRRSNIIDDS